MKLSFFIIILTLSFSLQSSEVDCENPINTITINYCAGKKVEAAEATLERYILKAEERHSLEQNVVDALHESHEAWKIYRKSYCDAIYDMWSEGTIRGAMFSDCMLRLTKQRTHTIWHDYLTYMDSTPPLLPEPK